MKDKRIMPAIIAGLLIVIGVMGYFLMKEREKSVSIQLPGLKIEAD
jgi:predicted nuclease with RNAse H fold